MPRPGPLHRLPPQCKLLAALLFVLAVVTTPPAPPWAFGAHAAVLAAVAALGRIPPSVLARGLLIEVPFLAFAVLLPVVGRDPRVDVLGVSLSEPGLWAAWTLAAKGTLGVATTTVVLATTPLPHVLAGLERFRVPHRLVAVMAFMSRYVDVLAVEARRLRIARLSRGDDPRWLWQGRALAHSAGAMFVRSYERGERVYLAMAATISAIAWSAR